MKKCTHSIERERIIAEAIRPVASELRLIDAADLVSLLRFERWANIDDLVASAAELYFLPGTVRFARSGEYRLDWDSKPEVILDLEIKPGGMTIHLQLSLKDSEAAIDINHIAFNKPSSDSDANTSYLAERMQDVRFNVSQPRKIGSAA